MSEAVTDAVDGRLVRIGRRYCAPCNTVRAVVYEASIEELPCPACGALTVAANGDEAR